MRTIRGDQRREVAARLREVETIEYDGDEWCDECDVLDALGLYNDGDLNSCDPEKVAFLADLIDSPTAKQEHNGAYWRCSHCGAYTRKDAVIADGLDVVPLRYCGNCGREWE